MYAEVQAYKYTLCIIIFFCPKTPNHGASAMKAEVINDGGGKVVKFELGMVGRMILKGWNAAQLLKEERSVLWGTVCSTMIKKIVGTGAVFCRSKPSDPQKLANTLPRSFANNPLSLILWWPSLLRCRICALICSYLFDEKNINILSTWCRHCTTVTLHLCYLRLLHPACQSYEDQGPAPFQLEGKQKSNRTNRDLGIFHLGCLGLCQGKHKGFMKIEETAYLVNKPRKIRNFHASTFLEWCKERDENPL